MGKTVTHSVASAKNTETGKIISFEKESGIAKLKQENRKITFINVQGVFQLDFNEEANASFMEDSTLRMVVLKPEKAANELNLQQFVHSSGYELGSLLFTKNQR